MAAKNNDKIVRGEVDIDWRKGEPNKEGLQRSDLQHELRREAITIWLGGRARGHFCNHRQ